MPLFLRIIDRVLVVFLREVARYRFNVIRENLMTSFPYGSDRELSVDITGYYFFLAKILRQVISRPSRRLLSKRMTLRTFDHVDKWLNQGQSIVVAMGHIGNWEWAGIYLGIRYPGHVCALYKQIKSKPINNWMLKRRNSTVDHLVEINKIGDLLRLVKKKPVLILMIADQNPGNDKGIIWTNFLNKETAFVNGPETLSSKYDMPVVYLKVMPEINGGYNLEFEILTDGKATLPAGEITSRYAKALEKNIHQYRHGWLWSHKRWKRKATK
jgi:KDO2-lipid IV(A) lauroyltransferase